MLKQFDIYLGGGEKRQKVKVITGERLTFRLRYIYCVRKKLPEFRNAKLSSSTEIEEIT